MKNYEKILGFFNKEMVIETREETDMLFARLLVAREKCADDNAIIDFVYLGASFKDLLSLFGSTVILLRKFQTEDGIISEHHSVLLDQRIDLIENKLGLLCRTDITLMTMDDYKKYQEKFNGVTDFNSIAEMGERCLLLQKYSEDIIKKSVLHTAFLSEHGKDTAVKHEDSFAIKIHWLYMELMKIMYQNANAQVKMFGKTL